MDKLSTNQQPHDATDPKVDKLDPEVLKEFLVLYNAARKEHSKAGKLANNQSPAHLAAVEFADKHGIPARPLLEAIVLSRCGQADMAWQLVKDKPNNFPEALIGQWHHVRGFVLDDRKLYDEAINEFQFALNTPSFDTPGVALNNLGLVYSHKKDHDTAIEYYQKALDTPGYDMPGYALNNLGNAYSAKKDYDKAIEYYQKALNTPGYTPGNLLNNLGVVYDAKKDHKKAIEYYEKALSTAGFGNPHTTQLNLARSLRVLQRADEAKAILEKVLAETDSEGLHEDAKFLKSQIESEIAKVQVSPSDKALSEPTNKDRVDFETVERIKDKLKDKEEQYKKYLAQFSNKDASTHSRLTIGSFHCLRGWSSAVTLLEGGDDVHWRGGGYFLQWNQKGIVIDPGFDFLDNFHDAGFHAMQIDVVLVSHNHSDHNYDLRALDDLLYEVYRRANKKDSLFPKKNKTEIVIDEDTANGFPEPVTDHRHTPLTFSRALSQRQRWIDKNDLQMPLTVEHFPVKHGTDVPHAVGMKLRFRIDDDSEFVFGYTGDTEYFPDLSKSLQGCDVLLVHISQPDEEELNDPDIRKKIHLGYNGAAQLINETNPKLTLIGEFWAGLADLRIELIQGLRTQTGKQNILPTGLGFHLHFPNLEVNCTSCGRLTAFDKIHIAPPSVPFGSLGFLCNNCII